METSFSRQLVYQKELERSMIASIESSLETASPHSSPKQSFPLPFTSTIPNQIHFIQLLNFKSASHTKKNRQKRQIRRGKFIGIFSTAKCLSAKRTEM
jgi:hypothetical protein